MFSNLSSSSISLATVTPSLRSSSKTSSRTWARRWCARLPRRPPTRPVTARPRRPCSLTLVREGAKAVAAGMNPMDLKRGVDLAVETIVADLKKNSKNVTSNEEIAQVGTISANGDAEIGRFIADAMKRVGNEGVITVEEAKSLETELEVVEGMQFDRGYIRPYL